MIELLNIDCMEYMKTVPDKYFELAIVDPPYGLNNKIKVGGGLNTKSTVNFHNRYKIKEWDTNPPTDEYFNELFRVSKNQIIWGGNYFGQLGKTRGFIFWYKHTPVPNFSDGEFAWTSFDRPAKCFDYRYTNILQGNEVREKVEHPTAKPVALYRWVLENYAFRICGTKHTKEYNNCCKICKDPFKILDTHLGSGSSAIAAYSLGFDFVGCELDEDYYKAAVKRYNDFKLQQTLF